MLAVDGATNGLCGTNDLLHNCTRENGISQDRRQKVWADSTYEDSSGHGAGHGAGAHSLGDVVDIIVSDVSAVLD